MTAGEEALRGAGIGGGDERLDVSLELARLARLVRGRPARSIGLAPAGDDVAVPAIALGLGRAIAGLCGRPVAVVDAHGSWPCARALIDLAGAPDGSPLATCPIHDELAVLTPRAAGGPARLVPLRGLLAADPGAFEHLVVDLTGLDHLGERAAAAGLLDATALVARSGRTTTRQIERALRDIPDGRGLGVLLAGL